MSHTVKINLIGSQEVSFEGALVNLYNLRTIVINNSFEVTSIVEESNKCPECRETGNCITKNKNVVKCYSCKEG